MNYNLHISNRAEGQLDNLLIYLLEEIKSRQAATRFIENVHKIYTRLTENPFQFPESNDEYLKEKGYREAIMAGMNYKIVFRISEMDVFILGIFHDRENYSWKL